MGRVYSITIVLKNFWSSLKRLTDCFTGLNGNIFYLNLHHDFNDKDYFNGYICNGILFMECERMKLGSNAKFYFLISILKYN